MSYSRINCHNEVSLARGLIENCPYVRYVYSNLTNVKTSISILNASNRDLQLCYASYSLTFVHEHHCSMLDYTFIAGGLYVSIPCGVNTKTIDVVPCNCSICLYQNHGDMGVSLKKGTTWGGRIQRQITNLLYTPLKKYLLYPDC